MSGSLRTFLVFCVLLAVCGIGLRLWAGPVMLDLMLDKERRAAPLTALVLVAPGRIGASASDALARKIDAMHGLMRDAGASLQWSGRTQVVVDGATRDEWQRVSVARFATGAAFVDFFTSGTYRSLRGDAPASRQFVMVAEEDLQDSLEPERRLVLVLVEAAKGKPGEIRRAVRDLLATLRAHGGSVRWETPVAVLQGDAAPSWVAAVQFEPDEAVERWLADDDAGLERHLTHRDVDRLVITILKPVRAGDLASAS